MQDSIGDRIARLRPRRGFTQESLAAEAGVSVDIVRKLEQNQRLTARLSTLNKLAAALDVETSLLIGQPTTLAGVPERGGPSASLLALRRAVTPVADLLAQETAVADDGAPPIAELRASLKSTEVIRRDGRLAEIAAILPRLIEDARSAAREHSSHERAAAFAVLAEAYQVAATTLTAFGKEDAAFTAMERAREAARQSDDERLEIIGMSTLSWIFCKQGRVDDAQRIAQATAEAHEPSWSRGPMVDVALWGILLLRAASAAVRADRRDTAEEFLRMANGAAARIGADRLDYATPFGPTNAGVATVNALVEMERPAQALDAARRIPGLDALPPTWQARYFVDRALAHIDLESDERATRAMLKAEQIAPEWMRYHATSRRVVADLATRERRRSGPVLELADRLQLDVG
ncbi:helix-turn-helix domain-containing protein [Yinghuangia seranimata]|uniref:helix-turn-helix domain-containing protein n=1 Tax=Yinghuangia seranimata TaxID=408067 RepID=UPI00248B7345|nr:helix-turn-helix domain-containing protein [Yinghuangia seranimata]MDI2132242.1 helix-turn-helix domain-containing protein [Yinghuangia seranimata]